MLNDVIARGLGILPDPVNPYLSLSSMSASKVAGPSAALMVEPRPIEDGVNELLYRATALTLRLATLAAPLLEPILGDEAAQFLAVGTLGLIGPLISGTGGLGHAVQDLVDSDNLEQFLNNSLDLVVLPLSAAVNGGIRAKPESAFTVHPAPHPAGEHGCDGGPGALYSQVDWRIRAGIVSNPGSTL